MGKIGKKLFCIFSALSLLTAPLGMYGVYANNNTTLQISSSQFMEIDEQNPDKINYYTNTEPSILTGSVQVKLNNSNDFLTPVMSGNTAVYNTATTEIVVELMPNNLEHYRAPDEYEFGETPIPLSGTQFNLTLTSGMANSLNFNFVEDNGGNMPTPEREPGSEGENMPGPMISYPIMAQFDVPDHSPIDVQQNEEGYIVIPENWASSKVNFKAKIFTKSDGTVEPFVGQTVGGTQSDMNLRIEGIANGEEINDTVRGSADHKSITIQEGFSEYGKLQLHLVSELESVAQVNQLLNVVHPNLINVKAEAPFSLSQSFGTVAVNQAIITEDAVKNVKIFFGNNESTLTVNGTTVDKITEVTGSTLENVFLNSDGSATVILPALNKETTTPVEIKILKLNGSSITRRINIVRTAIQLQHNRGNGNDTVYAGYVVNKGYLYNNQSHNDAIFNAYLQVILYKDNMVAGYKQIKIDDERLVNELGNNESGSLELYSEAQIAVYGKEAGGVIDGVNKVSVFLTNGPIDFNDGTLPSVEFGIGSGVTCEWGTLS